MQVHDVGEDTVIYHMGSLGKYFYCSVVFTRKIAKSSNALKKKS